MNQYISENNVIEFFTKAGRNDVISNRITGIYDKKLYYEIYPAENAIGTIIISHGYTEFCTKYREFIYYSINRRFNVFAYDQRGHGRSVREVSNYSKVHIDNFDCYVNDLYILIQNVVEKELPALPLLLYGHSMGGCVAARFIETYPEVVNACILSSPMFGINTGSISLGTANLIANVMRFFGQGKRYIAGGHDFRPDETFEESASACKARFELYNNKRANTTAFQLSSGDYDWLHAAIKGSSAAIDPAEIAKIKVPVLLFEAENDTYVPTERIAAFRDNLPGIDYVKVMGSKHEIYNSPDEVIEKYYDKVFEFFKASSSFSK